MQKVLKDVVQSLGREDPLEEGGTTCGSIPAWRIPMDGEAWRATVHGVAKSWTWLKQLSMHTESWILTDLRRGVLDIADTH